MDNAYNAHKLQAYMALALAAVLKPQERKFLVQIAPVSLTHIPFSILVDVSLALGVSKLIAMDFVLNVFLGFMKLTISAMLAV